MTSLHFLSPDNSASAGEGRVTVFASQGNARTFNYQPGDIGTVQDNIFRIKI